MHLYSRGFFEAIIDDGRPLFVFTGLCLALSGAFALFQSATGQFLPHDVAFLQMSPSDLCKINECRIVHFMIHDRVSFGGSLIAIAVLYLWLAEFPLRAGEPWAWWTLLASGIVGFGSFLAYLGYGYLDTWHGVATLFLLPVYLVGVWRSRPENLSFRAVWTGCPTIHGSAERWGRLLLGACAAGLILAGLTIAIFGMTTVFVPSDLRFIGLRPAALQQISASLIPVISYDRAGFGGGLCSIGCLLLFMARCADLNRSLVEIVAVMGCAGFGAALGVHFAVGYLDFFHLLPGFVGFSIFIVADLLLWWGWRTQSLSHPEPSGRLSNVS